MSHKGGKAAGKGKKPAGKAEKSEDVLQAVVIADYFQDRFVPFTLEKPRCLLTLANTPLIDYTLEFLEMNGVQEVIIYTSNHTDQIENYIHGHPRWSPANKNNPFQSVDMIRVSDASSVGDFLRDLDIKGLCSGDFILVHGDCVANISLDAALAKHKARREANREAVMTIVLRENGSQQNRTTAKGITPIFAIEATTGRCLHYEEMNPLQSDHYAMLDPSIFEHEAVEIRTDFIDPGIDICTPDALALWSESFDYELPRKNFLHGVLKDWELNGKFIYTEVVSEGYAARANNLQMYDSVTRDILDRHTFPLVPDSDMIQGHSYVIQKDNVVREKGVEFESDTTITKSIFGSRTSVGSGSRISNSVVGRRCFIGQNVKIEDSYIWDDATVEDGSVITRSVIGGSATVGKNCKIEAGSLVSFDVMISDNITIPPATVLSVLSHDREFVKTDLKLLGPKGKGATYKYAEDDEDDDEDVDPNDPAPLQKSLIYSLANFNISTSSVSTLSSDVPTDSDSDSDDDENDLNTHAISHKRLSSFASNGSNASDAAQAKQKAFFHHEAVSGLLDALRSDAASFDNAKLEFTSLRAAENASDSSMRRAVATAFARRALELVSQEGLKPAKAAERAVTDKAGAAKFVREVGVGGGSKTDQVEFVLAVQKGIVKHAGEEKVETAQAGTLLAAMLQHMYGADVLDEGGILAWWVDGRATQGEGMGVVRGRCQVLIDWLEEDSEEDDDEDSD
ncbi:translation initiation factor eIF-2B epsilon subunit, GEF [Gnomoniopsis sp. IMI 355080]|nr:translation initiation factor eIF-2B epsilon subunit, GEF [Gnomoniopsis sp. IMI 355080]